MTCPDRFARYPTRTAADDAIVERHLRAQLAGNPRLRDLTARPCPDCDAWHITRVHRAEGAAA